MPVFIAFSGKKQVGKNEAAMFAEIYLNTLGFDVQQHAFAYQLKKFCMDLFGIPEEFIFGTDGDKERITPLWWGNFPLAIRKRYGKLRKAADTNLTIREMLQVLGTDIFRNMVDPNVWAVAPMRKRWEPSVDVVLLTDCRFPDEARAVWASGGDILRITRDTGLEDNHESETALDDMDFAHTYNNNGTLGDLAVAVTSFIDSIIQRGTLTKGT